MFHTTCKILTFYTSLFRLFWPYNKTQNIEELVEAGFAFLRVDGVIKFYYCSMELRVWQDGPFASPKCSHVIHCKGKGFIFGERDVKSESDIDYSDYDQLFSVYFNPSALSQIKGTVLLMAV